MWCNNLVCEHYGVGAKVVVRASPTRCASVSLTLDVFLHISVAGYTDAERECRVLWHLVVLAADAVRWRCRVWQQHQQQQLPGRQRIVWLQLVAATAGLCQHRHCRHRHLQPHLGPGYPVLRGFSHWERMLLINWNVWMKSIRGCTVVSLLTLSLYFLFSLSEGFFCVQIWLLFLRFYFYFNFR